MDDIVVVVVVSDIVTIRGFRYFVDIYYLSGKILTYRIYLGGFWMKRDSWIKMESEIYLTSHHFGQKAGGGSPTHTHIHMYMHPRAHRN